MLSHYLGFARRSLVLPLLVVGWSITPSIATQAAEEEAPTLTLGELRAKYALPTSRYMDVDGIDLHYVDEGSGRAVVLLHASYQSLRAWDGLANRLKDNYRVLRFDFPNAGLSDDRKPVPPEKFNMMERYVDTLSNFADQMGLESFVLVSTSSGGSAAFRYTSANPEKVERLVLINTAGMPRRPRTDPLREPAETARWQGMRLRLREFWTAGLSDNFVAPHTPPEWMIDQAYDYARWEGRAEMAENYIFTAGDPKALLGAITSPTLILWGKHNPTVMHLEADVIQHWMTGAPSMIVKYEGLGHYPYIEDLDAIYSDLSAFIIGELDNDLRRTAMLRPGTDCECED